MFPLSEQKQKKKPHSQSPAASCPENTWCYSDKIKPYVLSFVCFGSSWSLGVKMSVNGLFGSALGPAGDSSRVYLRLLATGSWDRLQGRPSCNPVNEKRR